MKTFNSKMRALSKQIQKKWLNKILNQKIRITKCIMIYVDLIKVIKDLKMKE